MPKGKGYHTKKWAGIDVYECDSCPVDSEFKETIEAHVDAAHTEKPSKPTATPETAED